MRGPPWYTETMETNLDTNGFTNKDVRVEFTSYYDSLEGDCTGQRFSRKAGYFAKVKVWLPKGVKRGPEVGSAWLSRLVGYPALGNMIQSTGYNNSEGCWIVCAGL